LTHPPRIVIALVRNQLLFFPPFTFRCSRFVPIAQSRSTGVRSCSRQPTGYFYMYDSHHAYYSKQINRSHTHTHRLRTTPPTPTHTHTTRTTPRTNTSHNHLTTLEIAPARNQLLFLSPFTFRCLRSVPIAQSRSTGVLSPTGIWARSTRPPTIWSPSSRSPLRTTARSQSRARCAAGHTYISLYRYRYIDIYIYI